MEPCSVCFVLIHLGHAHEHMRWHKINGHHGSYCMSFKPSTTFDFDMQPEPNPCTCPMAYVG